MISWGMVGNSHDASLAVFETKIAGLTDQYRTKLLWASLAKDFTGLPNNPDFDQMQIEVAKQSFGPPSKIYWYEKPFLKTLRQWQAGQGWLYKENSIKDYLGRWDIHCPITYTQHHLSHAAYAYYTQPYDDCAVVCLDSIGEYETLTVWRGKNNKLKKIYSQGYPHSLGLFYSAMTQRLGLVPQRDEYLVAQMAKKGNPHKYAKRILKEILQVTQIPTIRCRQNLHRGCMWWAPDIKTQRQLNDLAAAVQKVFELSVKHVTDWVQNRTGCKYLALSGGGALNTQAVDLIRPRWKNIHVPRNPGDPGSCIGAVLAHTKERTLIEKQWYDKV